MDCQNCVKGKIIGIFPIYSNDVSQKNRKRYHIFECDICNGTGIIDDKIQKRIMDGKKIKEKRIQAGLTLREYCRINNLDTAIQSKIERGAL